MFTNKRTDRLTDSRTNSNDYITSAEGVGSNTYFWIIDVASPSIQLRGIAKEGNKPDCHDNQSEVSLGVNLVVPDIATYADVPGMDTTISN